MKSFAGLAVLAVTLSAFGTAASAASLAAPGVYYGSGNVNSNWTVTSQFGNELGLRASLRQNPADAPLIGDTYFMPLGAQTNITSGGNGANANRAAWNYDFSINTDGNPISFYTATMTISDNIGGGHSMSFNPITFIGDNAHAPLGFNGIQNSENPVFSSVFVTPYSMNNVGTYTIHLDVTNNAWGYTLSDEIHVNVSADPEATAAAVPLPAAAYAGFSLLGGMGIVSRWRRRKLSL